MTATVLVLGGGVGGMTAAHELAERGFRVTVVDAHDVPGGKARSYPAKGTGTVDASGHQRPDLPAEHGFRFFPGFYVHVPDTMRRIPFGTNPNGVFDNLVTSTRAEMARNGTTSVIMPAQFPHSFADIHLAVHDMFASDLGIPARDKAHFAERLLTLLCACEERRFEEYEAMSWWEFSGAATRSVEYQNYLAIGLTRTLVAAQATRISACTGGYILLQLLFDMSEPGKAVDRVLDGPTNDRWITPWLDHLHGLGVDYRTGTSVTAIDFDGTRIVGVDVAVDGVTTRMTADWYVAALPVEVFRTLITAEMKHAEPRISRLDELEVRWMNGVLFYLARDVPLVRGHTIYIDSPWALTSISQAQFWNGVDLSSMGDGRVHGILSVDVSDWTRPGLVNGKSAMECSKGEVIAEVWAQIKAALNVDGADVVRDDDVIATFVDTDIEFEVPHDDINLEPLLINTVGSWSVRPDAATAIPNLVLAADYVRTFTDLATMEGANEAARRATNAILDAVGSDAPRCSVWPLHEPRLFAPMREVDHLRYTLSRHAHHR